MWAKPQTVLNLVCKFVFSYKKYLCQGWKIVKKKIRHFDNFTFIYAVFIFLVSLF